MNEHLFVIGIGGTGMRCLEAFVHLCAMGMFDNKEINMLALDTDLDNGNFTRLKTLVEDCYQLAKGSNKTHYPLEDTFFSAKINFSKFTPDYSDPSKNGSFEKISKYQNASAEQQALADVLLSKEVREFDLKHGYRAQTHLGSMLMYHSIIEEVKNNPHGELASFIQNIYDAKESSNAKVFVLGSVFGGTGASSIPVIPKVFNKAISILVPGKTLDNVDYGATLLSSYFKFNAPDSSLRSLQKVVAGSKNFALNSQIAMMFYNEDKTVRSVYRNFYMLGTPSNDFETPQEGNQTITGGAAQKNDSHYIELLSACAAWDFFNTDSKVFEEQRKSKKEVNYFYRTINENNRIDFKDFMPEGKVKEFAKKFAALIFMGYITYPEFTDFVASAQSGQLNKNDIKGYEDILPREVAGLKQYFQLFNYSIDQNQNLQSGWLKQLHRSAGGLNNFLFNADMFGISNLKELKNYDINKKLFREDDTDINNYKFSTSIFSGVFSKFKEEFIRQQDTQAIQNKSEKLIKRMYDTINSLYGFKN